MAHLSFGALRVEILWSLLGERSEIGGIGAKFAGFASSACNWAALVIWCCPIMEMER